MAAQKTTQLSLIDFSIHRSTETGVTGLTVRTIEEQTGWKRLYPQMICQDIEALLRLSEYDYKLSDPDFVDFCRSRTGLYGHVADRWWFSLLLRHNVSKEEFFSIWRVDDRNRHKRLAIIKCDEELETMWRVYRIQKGKYQDCWELWLKKQQTKGGKQS